MCKCNNLRILNSRRIWNVMECKVEFEVIQECMTCGNLWVWSNLKE